VTAELGDERVPTGVEFSAPVNRGPGTKGGAAPYGQNLEAVRHALEAIVDRLDRIEARLAAEPRVALYKPNHRRHKDGGRHVHEHLRALRREQPGPG
jgi:hypothetical protein